jgi:hypothetical protein
VGQSDLPLASGAKHVEAFERAGWHYRRRAKDAHFILGKRGLMVHLSIPDHKHVKRALLQKQIKRAGLTESEYLDFYEKR